jgi:hypothetical protein
MRKGIAALLAIVLVAGGGNLVGFALALPVLLATEGIDAISDHPIGPLTGLNPWVVIVYFFGMAIGMIIGTLCWTFVVQKTRLLTDEEIRRFSGRRS